MAVDMLELANFPHTTFVWVGLQVTYGWENDIFFHVCQFVFPILTSKLSKIAAQNAFMTLHIYHIIIKNFV